MHWKLIADKRENQGNGWPTHSSSGNGRWWGLGAGPSPRAFELEGWTIIDSCSTYLYYYYIDQRDPFILRRFNSEVHTSHFEENMGQNRFSRSPHSSTLNYFSVAPFVTFEVRRSAWNVKADGRHVNTNREVVSLEGNWRVPTTLRRMQTKLIRPARKLAPCKCGRI